MNKIIETFEITTDTNNNVCKMDAMRLLAVCLIIYILLYIVHYKIV